MLKKRERLGGLWVDSSMLNHSPSIGAYLVDTPIYACKGLKDTPGHHILEANLKILRERKMTQGVDWKDQFWYFKFFRIPLNENPLRAR